MISDIAPEGISQILPTLRLYTISDFTASMLFSFLMGVYTLSYAATMYLYVTHRSTRHQSAVVLTSLALLYICCAVIWILDWYLVHLQWSFVLNFNLNLREAAPTPKAISTMFPRWLYDTSNGLLSFMMIVSDGLLIWRCFHVWNKSWIIILGPIFLLVCEIVLETATAALKLTLTTTPILAQSPPSHSRVMTSLGSSGLFAAFLTTTSTTSLIAYKIYKTSRKSYTDTPGTFTRIIKVLFESASAYSVVILIIAITSVIPDSEDMIHSPTIYAVQSYLSGITAFVSGMAPTILVARIVMSDTESDGVDSPEVVAYVSKSRSQLSALRFHNRTSLMQDSRFGSENWDDTISRTSQV